MYFETASLALSSVDCAISRIFSACSLICSLMALSIPDAVAVTWSSAFQGSSCSSLRRFGDGLQLLAKFVHQHAGIFGVIDRHHDEMHAAALECVFERRDQGIRTCDPRALCAVALGIFDEI